MTKLVKPEFSFVVLASALEASGEKAVYELEASPVECDALARRFGFVALEFFRATITLRPQPAVGFRLEGHILARVVQSCVVTLDPVISDVDERFQLLLLEEGDYAEEALDPQEDVDLYSGDMIDIAEIASEELALSLDPYPRSPEAEASSRGPGGPDESDRAESGKAGGYRPFEALAALKRRK